MNKSSTLILLLAGLGLGLGACESEIDGKAEAEVAEPPAEQPAEAPADAPAEEAGETTMLKAVPESSKIGFVGAKVTGDHTGEFKKIDGVGKLQGGALTSMTWTIDMASVESDHPKLTGHLKSDDFFAVEQFPTATFEATGFKATEGQPNTEVTGTLEMKGVEKQITFPAQVDVQDGTATVKAEFTIKRFDWNIEYKGKADDLIKDEVLIKADVTLKEG